MFPAVGRADRTLARRYDQVAGRLRSRAFARTLALRRGMGGARGAAERRVRLHVRHRRTQHPPQLTALREGAEPTRATMKLHVIERTFALRTRHPEAFAGAYAPIEAGPDVVAFTRSEPAEVLVVVTPREPELGTTIDIPHARWRNVLTDTCSPTTCRTSPAQPPPLRWPHRTASHCSSVNRPAGSTPGGLPPHPGREATDRRVYLSSRLRLATSWLQRDSSGTIVVMTSCVVHIRMDLHGS